MTYALIDDELGLQNEHILWAQSRKSAAESSHGSTAPLAEEELSGWADRESGSGT